MEYIEAGGPMDPDDFSQINLKLRGSKSNLSAIG